MNAVDFRVRLSGFWGEFRKEASGIAGLAILALFAAIALLEPLLVAFPQANTRWNDITYWDDNPKSAPPAWTNWFAAEKATVSTVVRNPARAEERSEEARLVTHSFPYSFTADLPPVDVILRFTGKGDIPLAVAVERPDGRRIELYREQAAAGERQEVRISLGRNAGEALFGFAQEFETANAMSAMEAGGIKPVPLLFSTAKAGMLKEPAALKGKYVFILTTLLLNENAAAENPVMIVSGGVFGILGTDNSKRDIWSGVAAGVKWALLIGLLTSFIAVGVGVVFGVTSAYFGGVIDALMQRVFEVFVNMPLLPILIIMSAVFKPSIWFMIFMMGAFFWVGPVKTVRSIALQIKEETYIEASRALGAGNARIIFRHMVPLLIPYAFASMALNVPGAVVYEATVSLLGLGGATITTWGQILHDALTGGAVLGGLWWWVVPPGIMIALMGMTFSFIGFAMDTILHPKLRTR